MDGPNKLVSNYTTLELLARDKHSSLFDPFVGCEENESLGIWLLGSSLVTSLKSLKGTNILVKNVLSRTNTLAYLTREY
jgi:hypothetical protein